MIAIQLHLHNVCSEWLSPLLYNLYAEQNKMEPGVENVKRSVSWWFGVRFSESVQVDLC